MMHGHEKSSSAIVAVKPTNKVEHTVAEQSATEQTAAEPVEPRAEAEGNGRPAQHAPGTVPGTRAPGAGLHTAQHRRGYPRWEPYAGKLQVRVCAGGARQLASLPRPRSFAAPAHVGFCAGFRTPATTISPRAPAAGVRKAPRHEIASGGGAPAEPQGAGAASRLWGFGHGTGAGETRTRRVQRWFAGAASMSKPARRSALYVHWSDYRKSCLRNESMNPILTATGSEPARTSLVTIADRLRRVHDVSILIAGVGGLGR